MPLMGYAGRSCDRRGRAVDVVQWGRCCCCFVPSLAKSRDLRSTEMSSCACTYYGSYLAVATVTGQIHSAILTTTIASQQLQRLLLLLRSFAFV